MQTEGTGGQQVGKGQYVLLYWGAGELSPDRVQVHLGCRSLALGGWGVIPVVITRSGV